MPSGSVLSRKCGAQAVAGAAERVGHELRAERRAADADHEQVAEALGARRPDPPVVHAGGEVEDARLRVADRGGDLRRGRQLRARAASSGRPSASRRGWRSPPPRAPPWRRAPACSAGSRSARAAVVEPHAAQVQPHAEARGRRTAGSCSAPRARVASWRLLVVRDGILPPAARPGLRNGRREAAHWRLEAASSDPLVSRSSCSPALALSCGGGGSSPTSPSTGGSAGTTSCTTLGQCTFVRDTLQDYYYWYKELPNPDPGSLRLARGLPRGRALPGRSTRASATSRRRPRATRSTRTASSSASASPTSGRARPSCASRRPSPAARPPTRGWTAGDTLLSVNGKAVADLLRTGEINTDLRRRAGRRHRRRHLARPRGAGRRRATLAKRLVTIPTVSQTAVLDAGGRAGRLHPLPQLRPALGRGPQHRLHPAPRRRGRRSSCSTCATTAAGSSRWPSTWRA